MATKLQIRRDTAANWTSANPTLSAGEFGFETDTKKLKIGDGSTAWASLAYFDDQLSGLDSSEVITLLGNRTVQHIIPAGNELYDLGDSTHRFRDLYLSGNTLKLGDATLSADSGGALTLPSTIKIGGTTLQATASGVTIGDSGGAILDSAAVLGFINAAYIQANQITYNNNNFADSAFVTAQINNLIDGAPGTLDTLNEIAAALNNDDSAYGTLLGLINAKTDYDSADTLALIDSAYIQARQTNAPSGVDSAAVTALIDSAYIQARQTSGGTVDSAQVVSIINNNTNSGFVWYNYTATQGQTTFQDSDNSGQVLSYDPNGIAVFYNGVLLTPNDFTASDQSSVVLGTGADSGENIAIFKWGIGYTQSSGGASIELLWGGDRAVAAIANSGTIGKALDYFDITTAGNGADFGDLYMSRYYSGAVSNKTRGVYISGHNLGVIDYINIATPGNATYFGSTANSPVHGSVSDGTYGVYNIATTSLGYITIDTTGNGQTFGNLTVNRDGGSGASNGTYGVFAGGYGSTVGYSNIMDYVTIATPSNATDFGDLQTGKRAYGGTGLNGQGVWGGGGTSSTHTDVIEYVTISTPGNATTWGNLTQSRRELGATANATRAVFCGGTNGTRQNTIDYITTGSQSNATDFGDLTSVSTQTACLSGDAS